MGITPTFIRDGPDFKKQILMPNNPNLYCIDVDDATWSTANWTKI
jgi:hypothetical protein